MIGNFASVASYNDHICDNSGVTRARSREPAKVNISSGRSFLCRHIRASLQSINSMCHIYYGSLTSCHFISVHPSSPLYPCISDYYNFCALSFSLGKTETKTSQEPAVLASKLPAGEIDVVVQN